MWTPYQIYPFYKSGPRPETTAALARSLKLDTKIAVKEFGMPLARFDSVTTLDIMVRPPIPLQHFAVPGLQASNVVVDLAARMAQVKDKKK